VGSLCLKSDPFLLSCRHVPWVFPRDWSSRNSGTSLVSRRVLSLVCMCVTMYLSIYLSIYLYWSIEIDRYSHSYTHTHTHTHTSPHACLPSLLPLPFPPFSLPPLSNPPLSFPPTLSPLPFTPTIDEKIVEAEKRWGLQELQDHWGREDRLGREDRQPGFQAVRLSVWSVWSVMEEERVLRTADLQRRLASEFELGHLNPKL
jgi:hypothetical protein